MTTLDIDGIHTPVHEAGPASAREAVVCVHGNPGSSEDWELLFEPVSAFARIVAPDMPAYGHGARPQPGSFSYTVEGYAAHLGKLIDALGIERVHLVVHDFGGPWGLRWAGEHPERIASLTLVNIGALPGYRWHYLARIWRAPIAGELFMAMTTRWTLKLLMNIDNPRPLPDSFIERTAAFMDPTVERAILELYRATPDLGAVTTTDANKLRARRVPTLVIWGEDDVYLPSRYAESQREFFDVQGLHRLPKCGHFPMLDEPARFCELLVPFLRAQLRTH